ncbi:unnamed protein product [Echinostoma caproni]|uniref:Secreted protein n=1 Tax=Echinostoma caproni TaxID=27848 RepID=A0A183AQT2_9TREM|nr:unnamed protein product [Echinostoma caproni]
MIIVLARIFVTLVAECGIQVRLVVFEYLALDTTIDTVLCELVPEVARTQLERVRQKEEHRRLYFIRHTLEQKPGELIGSLVLDILLPLTTSQSVGTTGRSRLEETALEGESRYGVEQW